MRQYFLLLIVLLITCFQGNGQSLDYRAFEVKLKPEYRAFNVIDDAEIKAIMNKHGIVSFFQSYPDAINPELWLYYTITGINNKDGSKENVIKDFLATGKFEKDESEDYFAVELKLKPQYRGYKIKEDAEFKALMMKYLVISLNQHPAGDRHPELSLYYDLTCKTNSENSQGKIIDDFLATGKFEDEVREYDKDPKIWSEDDEKTVPNFTIVSETSAIKMYPNPVMDKLIISGEPGNTNKMKIMVYDVAGRKVYEKEENISCEINISHLVSGIFFIFIYDGAECLTTNKFVKL